MVPLQPSLRVAALAARAPDGALHLLLEPIAEAPLPGLADVQEGGLAPANGLDGLHCVACLRLDHEDHRVVAEPIAQPTFYVHFRAKDDLLRTLATKQPPMAQNIISLNITDADLTAVTKHSLS